MRTPRRKEPPRSVAAAGRAVRPPPPAIQGDDREAERRYGDADRPATVVSCRERGEVIRGSRLATRDRRLAARESRFAVGDGR